MLEGYVYREEREIEKIAAAVAKAWSGGDKDSKAMSQKTKTSAEVHKERDFLRRLVKSKEQKGLG